METNPKVEPFDEKKLQLRDYFAAAALQGLIACSTGKHNQTSEVAAATAYHMADCMLVERNK